MNAGTSTLTGSEKQITWATEIRAAYLTRLESAITEQASYGQDVTGFETIRDLVASITDAEAIIDRRAAKDIVALHHRAAGWADLDKSAKAAAGDAIADFQEMGY